jgi:hypothetical protein
MASKYFESVKRTNFVDGATGEVTESITVTSDIFRRTDGEGNFVKLYITDLGILNKLQHKAMMVLLELVKTMDYKNEISVSIGKKKDMCKELDIYNLVNGERVLGTNIIDQHITKLVKSGLLSRKDKGMYIANPNLFGKGKWQDIKAIRMEFEYNDNGSFIKTEIEK